MYLTWRISTWTYGAQITISCAVEIRVSRPGFPHQNFRSIPIVKLLGIIDIGSPLVTLLQLKMPMDGIKFGRCDVRGDFWETLGIRKLVIFQNNVGTRRYTMLYRPITCFYETGFGNHYLKSPLIIFFHFPPLNSDFMPISESPFFYFFLFFLNFFSFHFPFCCCSSLQWMFSLSRDYDGLHMSFLMYAVIWIPCLCRSLYIHSNSRVEKTTLNMKFCVTNSNCLAQYYL